MIDWLRSHWPYIAPVLLVLLASLATALTRYPRAAGVVTALRVALDVLSVLVHRDSPGRWQWPFVERSPAPPEPTLAPELPRTGERPRLELVGPLLVAIAAPAHALAPAVQADMPPPPVDAPQWIPLAVLSILAAGLGSYLVFRRGGRGFVLVAALGLGLGASGCLRRNEVGGYDLISEAARARMAAVVDCLGAAVAVEAGPLLSGALAIVLQGQQREIERWQALLVPFVRSVEAGTRVCLKPPPAVAVRVTTDPPAIAVEAAP